MSDPYDDAANSASVQHLRETVEDLVRQFAYPTTKDGVPALTTGGLSALEGAFAVLGWSDSHPLPLEACEVEGCAEWATCVGPQSGGYKGLCGRHYREAVSR